MDYSLISDTLIVFLTAGLASFFTVPPTMWIANFFGLVDDPRVRFHPAHTHTGIIPRAGGLAILTGILISAYMWIPITRLFIGIFTASSLLVIIGMIDDYRDVNPFIRLGINAIASLIVIFSGATIPYITNPITGGIINLSQTIISLPLVGIIPFWSLVVAFLWIMWTTNIIGWSSGVDGQMPGFVAISAATIGLLSLRFSMFDPTQLPVTLLAFIVAGAFSGFLPWNFYPQKIMPGYGGKTLAGFLLALLAILSYAKLGTALLVLGIPMVDALYTLIRRVGSKKSPVKADRGHLHHKLLGIGWGRRKIALFYWIVSAILGAIALSVNSQQKLFAFLLLIVIIGGFIVWVNFFSQFSKPQDPDSG